MNTRHQASEIASKGRYGDSEIIHVAPWEVGLLRAISPTGDLTINPETGKPEAFIFSLLLPLLAPLLGAGTTAALGGTMMTAALAGALGGAGDAALSGEDPLTGAAMGGLTGGLTGGLGGDLFGLGEKAATGAAQAGTRAGLAFNPLDVGGAALKTAPIAAGAGVAPEVASSSFFGRLGDTLADNPFALGILPMMMGSLDGVFNPEEAAPGESEEDKKRRLALTSRNVPTGQGVLANVYRPANPVNYGQLGGEANMFPGFTGYAAGGRVARRRRKKADQAEGTRYSQPIRYGWQRPSGQLAFAEGGAVPPMPQAVAPSGGIMAAAPPPMAPTNAPMPGGGDDKAIVRDAMMALAGSSPDPQAAIQRFVARFGEEALADLQQRMAALQGGMGEQGGPPQGGPVQGPGDGLSDQVPAMVDGMEPAALSTDEHVIPADVVSGLGNGSSGAGHKVLADMANRVRMARGGPVKPPRINPQRMMPQ